MSQLTSSNKSSLALLLKYHIKENHLPSGFSVGLGQCALMLIAAAGFLYFKPAADFSEHEKVGIDKNTQAILNAMSTCYSAFIVLCAATIFFYRFHVKPQQVPKELIDAIEAPFTEAEYLRKNVILGTAAALSAVPFVTLAYMSYASLPNYLFYPFLGYIFLANTFLHFLPIKLILDDPLYGAIPRYIKKQLWDCLGLSEQKKAALDQQAQSEISQLIGALNSHFAALMNDLPNAETNLSKIKAYDYDDFITNASFSLPSTSSLTPQEKQVTRILGVFLVITSCIGYLANPYLVFNQELGFAAWQAALITLTPTFFLGVLFTYFGDTMGQRLWSDIKLNAQYFYRFFKQDPTNPPVFFTTPIFKLYPTTAIICISCNVFLSIFSAAAAMEMIHYAFSNQASQQALLLLYIIAQIGITIIGIYAPLDYQQMLMTYYALYLESGVKREIMTFFEGMNALQGDCYRLKPRLTQDQEIEIDFSEQSLKSPSISSCFSWCYRGWQSSEENKRPLLG